MRKAVCGGGGKSRDSREMRRIFRLPCDPLLILTANFKCHIPFIVVKSARALYIYILFYFILSPSLRPPPPRDLSFQNKQGTSKLVMFDVSDKITRPSDPLVLFHRVIETLGVGYIITS